MPALDVTHPLTLPLFSPFYQDPLMDMLNSAAATTAHGYIST